MTYEGWRNQETWQVNLHIENEERSYLYWTRAARRTVEDADSKSQAVKDLTEQLREELEESALDKMEELPEFARDLLIMSLREVDWSEIAEHMVDNALSTSLGRR